MEQKRVSFKVAKVLKDAGYPQELNDKNEYYSTNIDKDNPDYEITDEPFTPYSFETSVYEYYVAPTYLDVWLWLWREKKIHIDIDNDCYGVGCTSFDDTSFEEHNTSDPEESIIAAIEHLCENNLIK